MVQIRTTIAHRWRSETILDIKNIIPYKEYATITHRTLFIYIWCEKLKNIYSEWCHSTRQLRTDGGPRPFLKLKNITFIDKTRHFSAPQAKQAKIYLGSVFDLTDNSVTKR